MTAGATAIDASSLSAMLAASARIGGTNSGGLGA